MIKDTIRVYHNEKLFQFFESLSSEEQVVAHKVLQFFRTEFPECENALRGKLVREEIL